MKLIDLHIHSNYSDGSDSIEELVQKIEQAGIEVFSLTDHDTIDGNLEIKQYIHPSIQFINGVELTCKMKDIKCHILGYNYNLKSAKLHNLIQKGKILRRKKLKTRINYLKEVWNIELTKDELDWLYSRKSVVKTHLANILVKRGLAEDNLSAMKKYLDDCPTGNSRFDGEEALNAITAAGGISIWAHPLGGEGEKHLTQDEFMQKLVIMKEYGIQGLECYYSRYNKEESEFLLDCAQKNNLLISCGSDYHGTNKNISLARLNTEDTRIPAEKITILANLLK